MSKHYASTSAATVAMADVTSSSAREVLRRLASDLSVNAVIEIGKTSLMEGDFLLATQDVTVSVWYSYHGSPADTKGGDCYPDEYYRCTDADSMGGDVRELNDGRAVVEIGNAGYLDVTTGEILDRI